jgi:hypothetical protein
MRRSVATRVVLVRVRKYEKHVSSRQGRLKRIFFQLPRPRQISKYYLGGEPRIQPYNGRSGKRQCI